jgi:hypothetical protein
LANPAAAALHDHLRCYKVKDPASFSATVDLRPTAGVPFEVDAGCTVKVRSRQLCFPVEKDLVESGGTTLGVSGQELENAFLCYAVKCPPATLPASIEMSDQFGTRALTGLRPSTVCAPAIVGAPPPTTTTTTTIPPGTPRNCADATPPNCDGTCNDYNFACVADSGACVCFLTDVWGSCPMPGSGPPECYGTCSGSQTCIEVGGACQCGFAF